MIQAGIDGAAVEYLHAHNLWLNVWLETGWLGLVAALAITAIAALAVVRLARDGAPLAPAIGAALAGFAAASLVDHAANTTRIAIALALVLALLAVEYGAPRSLLASAAATRPAPAAETLLDD